MTTNKNYPSDFILINQNAVRITALIVLLISITHFFTETWIIPALLSVDFALRAFKKGGYSFLNTISEIVVDFGGIDTLPTNDFPKRFEAKIGLLICLVILAATVLGFSNTAITFTFMLAVFALLESVFDFYPGWHIYNFLCIVFREKK